ncbi:glycosyltransferase family 2 protein [Providencia rettgeri]|uniref:glycosyltransferase family 2 protein n=2 Tax=Providencia rettgeri TaxID=587 RepID=UPI001C8387C0|nr:glycosyltransferase family A protein [Providencia rettgeri]MBX6969485.1 glycosyltransferase family 2 protein [Providencia rettgeri]MBX6976636.1 glycosyltransferase family 2 protein [Providencia rettgeri]MBX6995448.1 glycosyltransferase family 2 protein [Providencia rettgeri]MBX7022678.1 glycosyltransferase family 2 protein [Providencia rettgeri]MBX7026934.1 glycosyltransferase family 2 protein [Providencia rettgeri]
MIKFEVLISTLNDGLFNIKLHPDFNYLIIHQITNNKDYSNFISHIVSTRVRYIPSNTIGLSISRNIALSNSIGEYLWIMDDDVLIYSDALEKLNNLIKTKPNQDMYILNFSQTELKNETIEYKKANKYNAMSICSINMLLTKDTAKNHKFNTNFGLGTNYPSGEEYIFSIELINKNKKILITNEYFSCHPELSSGNDFYSSPNRLHAKLKMFLVCYGSIKGRFIYLLFVIKKTNILIKNKAFFRALACLIKS